MRDWTGNSKTAFAIIGASNHSECDREANDYYATEPRATELLLEVEKFSHHVWECACGEKHMSNVLEAHGYDVRSSDIFNRGGTPMLRLSISLMPQKTILIGHEISSRTHLIHTHKSLSKRLWSLLKKAEKWQCS